ncbi:hypothetical protein GCM10010464_01000 [Pseudonocardia yunnanensis]
MKTIEYRGFGPWSGLQCNGWWECSTSITDSRLNPKTTSASFQVPLSSGPRWRAQRSAPAIDPVRPAASALAVSSPSSPHTASKYADGAPHRPCRPDPRMEGLLG